MVNKFFSFVILTFVFALSGPVFTVPNTTARPNAFGGHTYYGRNGVVGRSYSNPFGSQTYRSKGRPITGYRNGSSVRFK